MNTRLAQTLLVASLGAFAFAASAQNATPRVNPSSNETVNTTTQNGMPSANTPATTPATGYGTSAGTMANPNAQTMPYKRLNDADVRAYKDARAACDRLTGAQQTTCRTQFSSSWNQVDPKCQKVSGSALDDCLKGADHGAQ